MMASDTPAATADEAVKTSGRSNSFSNQSDNSQTAAEFIRNQELLEADAREALPYSIDTCTKILGPLRQNVFACLTCNPPPKTPDGDWTPAGVCYACSIQCHGEHTLVEIFQKRNFTCDCGSKRIPSTSPCTLRLNEETNTNGVHSEEPDANNKYNHNFRNRFCGCECDYDPFQQKGTMFQCLGLGTQEAGGCGEDWYHPGCLVGMGPNWFEKMEKKAPRASTTEKPLATISEGNEGQQQDDQATKDEAVEEDDEPPMPPGFPDEDSFEGFLCYKCVEANPWIKRYAGSSGFLPAVFVDQDKHKTEDIFGTENKPKGEAVDEPASRKRKAEDDTEVAEPKRLKSEDPTSAATEGKIETPADVSIICKVKNLPAVPEGSFSLFCKEEFRNQLCRCPACFPLLNPHPQLLEEEEVYEPPLSEGGASQHGGSTAGSGSLLERGESALRNVDRVRAIEGVMAYNHLKEWLKPFFQQFAESGQAIGAEDIKAYFAKLRGDEQGIQEAGEAAASSSKEEEDRRREQGGY